MQKIKPSEIKNVCILCGIECKTMPKNCRICEEPMVQKLLNAALFKDRVYTETAVMRGR